MDPTLKLPGLSPVIGKTNRGRFDGGRLSSDGGLLVLREIKRRLSIADRLVPVSTIRVTLSTCICSPDIIRFRLLMIAADHEHGNDATSLRPKSVKIRVLPPAPFLRAVAYWLLWSLRGADGQSLVMALIT